MQADVKASYLPHQSVSFSHSNIGMCLIFGLIHVSGHCTVRQTFTTENV